MMPIVALVGRPNVGKSTMFNRLVGRRGAEGAVVDEAPGTTRDRLYGTVDWRGLRFALVDTGGMDLAENGLETAPKEIRRSILGQAEAAILEADLIVFVTSARDGPIPADVEIADRLRRSAKPVILAANKADNPKDRQAALAFFELGLADPIVVSAIHGTGTGDLLDRILDGLGEAGLTPSEEPAQEETAIAIAIVGRPNVGKSSLLNAVIGEDRAIVTDTPGTTRDALDTTLVHDGRQIVLIDTAGIRRRGRIARGVETYSVLRAMKAVERADVAIVVIDAQDGVTAQDAHVAGYAHEATKGCLLAINKWDAIDRTPDAGARYLAAVRRELPFLDYAPVLFISAKTGLNVNRLLERAIAIWDERSKRISTPEVNEFVREAVGAHPLTERGRALKVLYATQAATHPPTFVFFVNDAELVHFSYRRYLENQLRRRFGFEGTALRLVFRGRSDSRT